jgi:hypothetical protein
MKCSGWTVGACLMGLSLAAATSASAQQQTVVQPAVRLQTVGTLARGGEFAGTLTINRFEPRATGVVAVGYVQGVLYRGGRAIGTAFAGEVVWPVSVRAGSNSLVSDRAPAAFQLRPARWLADSATPFRIMPAQAQCPVLDLTLAPIDLDLLGFQVSLSPVTLNVSGGEGPLGELVCSVSDLLGNVAGLVDVLNGILGLLTGLLGGLLGGLGI